MKVVWLTQYNIFKLLPEVELNREVILHNSSWVHTLSEELASKEEIELHIITHSNLIKNTQKIQKDGIHFHVIKYAFPFTNRGFPWYAPLDKLSCFNYFSKHAKKIIKQIQPDVLHVHGTEGAYSLPAFKTDIPCIVSIQGIIRECMKCEPTISGYMQIPYEQFALRKGKFFGCRTNFDFEYVKKKNKDAIIFDLPEAINKVFFEQQWNPNPGLSLLFVGSVIKRKGIEDLIRSVYKLKNYFPSIELRIIGSGTKKYIGLLKVMVRSYGLQANVHWLGNKEPKDIAIELSKCNFFVLPTLIDNSPNCLAEAMAVGVPSIATNVGGIPSMVTDNYDAMLFEKNDSDGLVNIIKQLVNDKALQNRLSINAKRRAFERNYPSNVAPKYIKAYKSIQ